MSGTVIERYDAMAAAGELAFDPEQAALAERLTRLSVELVNRRMAEKQSHLGWIFARRHKAESLKGVYVWGEVGRGKTMLVDLFFETVTLKRKRRSHFSDFMADVHARVHDWRVKLKDGAVKGDDPIRPVADAIADECRLLCLDEFHVDDITDAMILGRLFTRLFDRGLVLVTTSNTKPRDLYRDGLNRSLFLPFLALLESRVDVVCLDAGADYRLGRLRDDQVYFSPADEAARRAMNVAWRKLTGTDRGKPSSIEVLGRKVRVPERCRDVARFTFADLCEAPLGANDYLAVARTFHTVFLDAVPVLRSDQRNEARRFVLLIDALYDHRAKLVVSADAEPDDLYAAGDSAAEFKRTASRLYEMRSRDYLDSPHGASNSSRSVVAEA